MFESNRQILTKRGFADRKEALNIFSDSFTYFRPLLVAEVIPPPPPPTTIHYIFETVFTFIEQEYFVIGVIVIGWEYFVKIDASHQSIADVRFDI